MGKKPTKTLIPGGAVVVDWYAEGYAAGLREGARRERRALKRAWGGMSSEFDEWLKSRARKGKAAHGR